MACSLTLTGRSLPCRDALGGVKKVWIVTTAGGTANTSFTDDLWTYDAAVGDVVGKAGTVAKDYVSPKNTSSFTQTVNASVENGTVFYTQVLSLVLNKPVVADIVELKTWQRVASASSSKTTTTTTSSWDTPVGLS
jgi:hypothetical protein